MKKLLVRADDLGYCEAVNYGIERAVKHGIIRTVGLMPNMESAEHGVSLLSGLDICYGQHTNICNGRPLTDPQKIPSLVNSGGEFKAAREYRQAKEDFVILEEAILEIEAQYQRFVSLTHQKPHYLEAHAVPSKNFEKGLQTVARMHDVPYLELAFGRPVHFRNSDVFVSMDSMFPNYDPFESLKKAALREVGAHGCVAMICHPGYVDDYVLKTSMITTQRAEETAMLTADATRSWLSENGVSIITYDDL